MEDGFVFWIIIFAVAVLQGIGQKKRKPGQKGGKVPRAPRPKRTPRPVATTSTTSDEEGEETSEGMIPSDVWAEILGLARGETPKAEEELPKPEDSTVLVDVPERKPRPSRDEAPLSPPSRDFPVSHGADAVHHPAEAPNFESRLAIQKAPDEAEKRSSGKGIKAGLFGSGSARDLRKAVVLQEVLGAPVSMKEES